MRDVRELYPDRDEEPFYGPTDYQPLIASLGHAIELQREDRDYQGDTFVLLRRADGVRGVLIFGWGSCSGCDSLQACETFAEIEKLRANLAGSIHWDADAALAAWLRERDATEWYTHHDAWAGFRDAALAVLGSVLS